MRHAAALFALQTVFLVLAATGGAADTPASPGAAALLIDGKVTSVEIARWEALLANDRPLARATAGRIAAVTGERSLLPALLRALEAETDPGAARELIMAIGRLGPGDPDETLFRAAARFGGRVDATLAHALALRGKAAIALAPRLAELKLRQDGWAVFFAWASPDAEDIGPAADAALSTQRLEAWEAVLSQAAAQGRTIDDETLASGLRSGVPGIRIATCLHLGSSDPGRAGLGQALAGALDGVPEAREDAPALGRFAHELASRAVGRPARDHVPVIARLTPAEAARIPLAPGLLARLRRKEREALAPVRVGPGRDARKRLERLSSAPPPRGSRPAAPVAVTMRTVSDLPPGLAEEILAAAGCRPASGEWAELRAQYGPGGHPERLDVPHHAHLSPPCATAAGTLLRLSVIPGDSPAPAGRSEYVLLPLDTSFLDCPADDPSKDSLPARVGGRITEPKKVHNVAPSYPPAARDAGRQGVVVMDAVVSSIGCIRSVKVVQAVSPDLDFAALRAVTQWRYTPTLLDGVAVPVIMTVTVNFRLN